MWGGVVAKKQAHVMHAWLKHVLVVARTGITNADRGRLFNHCQATMSQTMLGLELYATTSTAQLHTGHLQVCPNTRTNTMLLQVSAVLA